MRRHPTLSHTVALASVLAGPLLLAAPLHAEDSRLVTRAYNDAEVVKIEGKMGVQATIGFGENETIENVAVGDAEKWQITPNKRADLLFVKPLEASARTNMTVVTDKHTYFFDLVSSPSASPIYMLRFTYGAKAAVPTTLAAVSALPDKGGDAGDPAKVAVAAAPTGDPGESVAPAAVPLAEMRPGLAATRPSPATGEAIDPAMLNFSWTRKGNQRLDPVRLYDDGNATYLLFGQGQSVPAILVRGPDGVEQPAEFELRGNTIVLASVPREIILRGSKASLVLENRRIAAPAASPAAGAEAAVAGAAVADRSAAQAN